jgi:hypothetical protein
MYLVFIRPIMEYADIVWDSPMNVLEPLEKIQRNAARIVTGATAKCSTQGLYDETAWQPLAYRRESHRLVQFYKIMTGRAPSYLSDLVPDQVGTRTRYELRNRQNLDLPIARINSLSYSFFPTTAKLWNNLRTEHKSKPSIQSFKMTRTRNLPKKNPLYSIGARLESCIHSRLRIGNSPLNAHLCNDLHVIPSPICPCGAGQNETPEHFFLTCSLFDQSRNELKQDLLPYVINNVDFLLYGVPNESIAENTKIFTAVHKFIRNSKRFY